MVQNKSNLSLANRRQSSFFRQLPPAEPDVYYIGVDVGTGSARACLIDTNGIILGLAERPIKRQELEANYITQNSTEIWEAICYCVRSCLRDSGVQPEDVFGIGFDATCSLVAISELTDQPVLLVLTLRMIKITSFYGWTTVLSMKPMQLMPLTTNV